MAATVTSGYNGEFLDEIVIQLTTGNPTVSGDNIRIHSGINKKLSIVRLKASDIIQAYKATPEASDSGTLAYDETSALTGSYMLYARFDPETYADLWRPFQPTGAFVFQTLPDAVKMSILKEYIRVHSEHLEQIIWQGDSTLAAPSNMRYFDGAFKKAADDANVIDVATPVTLTDVNIVGELGRVLAATPKKVKDHPDFKIFISTEDHELYGDAQAAKSTKGTNDWDEAPLKFKGKNLVPLPGVPKDKMLALVASSAITSNFHLAIKFRDDANTIKADVVANDSEEHFVKMAFRAGVLFSFGEEVTAYNA
jgi:hypothetical protein